MGQGLSEVAEGRTEFGARWLVGTAVWVVVFVALAVGLELLGAWSAGRSGDGDGADIVLAVLLLAGLVVLASLAGAWDGWRWLSGRPLLIRWVLVGLLAAIAEAIYRSAGDGELNVVNVVANFALSTVILAVVVAGAASVAGVVGYGVRKSRLQARVTDAYR